MAELRQRLGRGAYDFLHKIYNRHLLEAPRQGGKGAIQVLTLKAEVLSDDIKNVELSGAENASYKSTVGASGDNYTSVTPVLDVLGDIWGNGNVAECEFKVFWLSHKNQVQLIERNVPRYAKFERSFSTSSSYSRCLSWGHGQFVFIRNYRSDETRSEPLYRSKTGYYDILEVLPTATHAQIKTAYYKQSFVYHPDRNSGSEEATLRFSEISEAYMVLGNKALRKKYDRGLLSQTDLTTRRSSKEGTGGSARKQTENRRSVLDSDIRGGLFDFHKFYKFHYSEQLQRQKDIRARKEKMLKEKQETISEKKLDWMVEICAGILLVMTAVVIISLKK